jgi:hypothetical protein
MDYDTAKNFQNSTFYKAHVYLFRKERGAIKRPMITSSFSLFEFVWKEQACHKEKDTKLSYTLVESLTKKSTQIKQMT